MDLLRLLRYLRGYVKFSVQSGPGERLLNLCARRGIALWDCRGGTGGLSGYTSARGYRRMHTLARKAGVRLRVQQRHGLPFLFHRYRRRGGIAVGVALFVLVLLVSQQFVWTIEIQGNRQIDEAALRGLLTEMGVRQGALKHRIDPTDVKQQMQLQFNELAWSTLNIEGTKATLLLRERTLPLPKIDTGLPANVVAAADGQIKYMEVTDGVPVRRLGDTVRAGELIVSGIYEDRWGLTHLMRANAKVLAHLPQAIEVRVPLEQERYQLTGKSLTRRYLEVAGVRIPLFLYSGVKGAYKLERSRAPLQILGLDTPLFLSRERYIFYERQSEQISSEFALRLAKRQLAAREKRELVGTLLSCETAASEQDGVLVLRGDYLIEGDIARQVEIGLYDRSLLEEEKPKREGGY